MNMRFESKRRFGRRCISLILSIMMISSALTVMPSRAVNSIGDLTVEQPVLLVTGQGIIENGIYTSDNVSNERSYTLTELQALGLTDTRLYSAINSVGTRRIYRSEGAGLVGLLALSEYRAGGVITAASGTFTRQISLDAQRFYYPGIADGTTVGETAVDVSLAWKSKDAEAPAVPGAEEMVSQALQLQVGQLSVTDVNNSLFVNALDQIRAGDAITGTHIKVLGSDYTRAQILMMPRSEGEFTYFTQGSDRTDRVRGTPLSALLEGLSDSAIIEFQTADNWSGISAYSMTKGELVSKNAILAYERIVDNVWRGYCDGSGSTQGIYRLFVAGMGPAQRICVISVGQAAVNPYKHITNGGLPGNTPYNIDAVTGATLTVEGPGVVASTPITVRQLEETDDKNIHRGVYVDNRGSFTYEGVKLLSILDGLIHAQVERLDDEVVVVFKNRWRQDMGRITYGDIKNAQTPIIMAYGTASADGATLGPAPFVFNNGAGKITIPGDLGNDDGPLKLVYGQNESFSSPATEMPSGIVFASVAYLYIEEGTPPPGFKHIEATDEAYRNKSNTEYLLTLTGSVLGREINFTTAELEAMVEYDNGKPKKSGMGHRDEYSLSNTTYWYVNEYEGVKLWDLLTSVGVDAETYKGDDSTLVSFSSWDNYQVNAQFSMAQLANPDLFYFYEKSPLDIGANRPTKEQLATPDYQPDNQVGEWVSDSNGYPVKKGYPVLLAYGLNGYPYVRDSNLAGFKSGLGNSGGPMRLIYGKTDGLNRSNPMAEENYAYFFNNGSQQLQRVQEVYVGDGVRYSTHLENPDASYRSMKDVPNALTVEIITGGTTTTRSFTLAELESLLYGEGVTKRDMDSEGRQEKGYYNVLAGGIGYQDLYEGVNLEYLLTEVIGMQGTLGTVELYGGTSSAPSASYDLSTIGDKGYNSLRGTDNLGMMVAFSKNGYPLVAGSSDPGYISTFDIVINSVTVTRDVKNNRGPLQFLRGQTASERDSGTAASAVNNLTKIVVNLEPDPYAHVGEEFSAYAEQEIRFSGAVSLTAGVSIKVGVLETMQKYMVTGSYTVGSNQRTYRGLDMYKLLNDKSIGASALMSEITVKGSDGSDKTLTLEELLSKNVILAYGIADASAPDGRPLVTADGGPMRLIFDGASGTDTIKEVTEIVVSASTLDGWKHNTGIFTQYANYTLEITGQNLAHNKTYTVAEIEAMDNIIVSDSYNIGGIAYFQGVPLYRLLQNIGFSGDLTSSNFTAYAIDGYQVQFTANDLERGINGKPILVAFGRGTSPTNGLPKVSGDQARSGNAGPGYDPNIGNDCGPLRLIVHDNAGWAVKELNRIVVGAAGGAPDPSDPSEPKEYDFKLYPGGENGIPWAQVSTVITDESGGIWVGTAGGGASYIAPTGEITTYTTTSSPALMSDTVTVIAIDSDGVVWLSQGGGSLTEETKQGFARFKNGVFTFFSRNNTGGKLPNNRVNGLDVDELGNVWLATTHSVESTGTYPGGITKYDTVNNTWETWTQKDGIPKASTWAIKADNLGGAWATTYYSSTYDGPIMPNHISYVYITPEGDVVPYVVPAGTEPTQWGYSVAMDSDGGTYVLRFSGTSDSSNSKGRLDYIAPGESSITRTYSAAELLPASDLERIVSAGANGLVKIFVDAGDSIWITSDSAGVYRFATAFGVVDKNSIEHYSSDNGSWPAGPFDSVWSIYVSPEGTAVIGSNGGIAVMQVQLSDPPSKPDPDNKVGDATEETAQLRITGAVEKPGYFTLEGLKNYAKDYTVTRTYATLNSVGTRGTPAMTGIYLEDLLTSVMKLNPDATSVTVTASDNMSRTFWLDRVDMGVYWTNYEGNKLMLAWERDGDPVSLRVAVPQIDDQHVNNALWVSNIVSITVGDAPLPDKLPQNAPSGLLTGIKPASEGGRGSIDGTTTAMQYSDNQVSWFDCASGYTEVFPGQYYVRYSETATHSASAAVNVTVPEYNSPSSPPPSPPGNAILSIYNGSTKLKDFTQSEINALNHVTNNYSANNSFPTYSSFVGVRGVTTNTLFSEAGISPSANSTITFYSSDGFAATLRAGDLTAARYFFSADGTRGSQVPAVISFGSDGVRLYFGQISAQEQTNQAFVKDVDRIVIGGQAGSWGRPSANPASGIVSAGDEIRLSLPPGSGDAKVYYTLDGAIPTVNSAMYNVTAERWLDQKGMTENPPIIAPSDGPFSIRAVIIGLGRTNGDVATFNYNGANLGQIPGGTTTQPGEVDIDKPLTGEEKSVYFSDVNEKWFWAAAEIDYLYEKGIIKGVAPGQYAPGANMIRGDFVLLIARAFDLTADFDGNFPDVPKDSYFYDAIAIAKALGLVEGDGTNFHPRESITRQEMMTLLDRILRMLDIPLPEADETVLSAFADSELISPYARKSIAALVQAGIVRGDGTGVNPLGTATRAEMAVIIYRVLTMKQSSE